MDYFQYFTLEMGPVLDIAVLNLIINGLLSI